MPDEDDSLGDDPLPQVAETATCRPPPIRRAKLAVIAAGARSHADVTAGWLSVREAAHLLGFAPVSLRRAIERNARRAPDGGIEASFDGVRAKKLGRTWRVMLGERWRVNVAVVR